uniref:Uncharacterized protein n=1 Tax=Tetraselmis chuii TaxID=63592 RepID=A0A7S1SGE5_9CHLO
MAALRSVSLGGLATVSATRHPVRRRSPTPATATFSLLASSRFFHGNTYDSYRKGSRLVECACRRGGEPAATRAQAEGAEGAALPTDPLDDFLSWAVANGVAVNQATVLLPCVASSSETR